MKIPEKFGKSATQLLVKDVLERNRKTVKAKSFAHFGARWNCKFVF